MIPVLDHGFVALDGALAVGPRRRQRRARLLQSGVRREWGRKTGASFAFSCAKSTAAPSSTATSGSIVKAPLFVVREHHRHRSRPLVQRMEWALCEDRARVLRPGERSHPGRQAGLIQLRAGRRRGSLSTPSERLKRERDSRFRGLSSDRSNRGSRKSSPAAVLPLSTLHEVLLELQSRAASCTSARSGTTRPRSTRSASYAAAARSFFERQMPITHAAFVANDRTAP